MTGTAYELGGPAARPVPLREEQARALAHALLLSAPRPETDASAIAETEALLAEVRQQAKALLAEAREAAHAAQGDRARAQLLLEQAQAKHDAILCAAYEKGAQVMADSQRGKRGPSKTKDGAPHHRTSATTTNVQRRAA